MQEPPAAPGEDRSLALALANTLIASRGQTVDLVPDAASITAWLDRRGLSVRPITAGDVAALAPLREAVRAAFAARTDGVAAAPEAIDVINRAAAGTPAPRLRWSAGGPTAGRDEPSDLAGVLALAAADAIELVTGERAGRLRRCAAHGCIRFFVQDHGRRRWCSRACGDRVRVARHYRRQHHGDG